MPNILIYISQTQTPLKLVSAMKGSSEKEGIPLKKLTVNWDPDVKDVTNSVMLEPIRKKGKGLQPESRSSKKNAKKNRRTMKIKEGKKNKQ